MKNNRRFLNLKYRSEIIQSIRHFFLEQGFIEVETPHLIPANAPEEYINPISVNSWYLQTSPELSMKRLLCRGYEKIFQISHCWRQGERGKNHLPEFTMLEWYRTESDYNDLMDDCEKLLLHLTPLQRPESLVQFNTMLQKITIHEAFRRYAEGISVESSIADDTFDILMVDKIEPSLPLTPVFLCDYPAPKAALAKTKANNVAIAERFELYVGGLELANGFSELNDQSEQRLRFMASNEIRIKSENNPLPIPEPFLSELSAMPPSAGIALGIDRLIMLATGSSSIDEVVAFCPEEL